MRGWRITPIGIVFLCLLALSIAMAAFAPGGFQFIGVVLLVLLVLVIGSEALSSSPARQTHRDVEQARLRSEKPRR